MLKEAAKGSPEYWAQKTPTHIALVKNGQSMTYQKWNDKANRVADALLKRGLKAGDRLGMRFHIGFEWSILQRALQKIGVVQVAVNWKLTAAEASYILRDSGAVGLGCDDVNAAPWLEEDIGLLITVGQDAEGTGLRLEDLINEGECIERFGPVQPNSVLYTSGTTGKPKGIAGRKQNMDAADIERLMKYQQSVASHPPAIRQSISLLSMPTHHGVGQSVVARVAGSGGTLIMLDPFDPEEALRLIDHYKVDSWVCVPTMLLKIRALPHDTLAKYDTSSLRVLGCGASAVPFHLKQWVFEYFGTNVLWENYGISEVGVVAYLPPEYQLQKPGCTGIPYDGVLVDIVDEHWNRLPANTEGEIAINSPMVLKNYIGQDALDDETLKDGFFRTGDVGYLDDDGFIFITDRKKDMIVAGGVNIYPAEIEAAIIEHPDVQDVAVIGIPDKEFGEKPMAFIVSARNNILDEKEILAFLDKRLASFKKPRAFKFVDELPTNPAGKVLKTELRAPYWEGQERKV